MEAPCESGQGPERNTGEKNFRLLNSFMVELRLRRGLLHEKQSWMKNWSRTERKRR